jgi:UDP-N-acetylmuramoylalanine--D-glutamate ligase
MEEAKIKRETREIKEMCGFLQGREILLLGFGAEGKSTYNFIRRYFPDKTVAIADKKNLENEGLKNVVLYSDKNGKECLDRYDAVIKSPGIVLDDSEKPYLDKITSQTELFLKYYAKQTIGITGTKGKSTTASLVRHVLAESEKDALLVGNIGLPVFDVLERIRPETWVVYELSSHQLEYVRHSPHIAVHLNIFEEHLDHYGTFDKYARAKENIFRYQQEGDILVYNREFIPGAPDSKAELITISNRYEDADGYIKNGKIHYKDTVLELNEEELKLKGQHNLYNIGVASIIARLCGISEEQFVRAVRSFKPLPHRLEYVGEIDGVTYYNDSISTICETTIQGINSLKNVGTVLLGGMDRGIDYRPLAEYLLASDIETVILMPDTGYRLLELLKELSGGEYGGKAIRMASGLEQAVEFALENPARGRICLFSPAAASYGFFRNFEDRGERFKKLLAEKSGLKTETL